jgi:class 3 adenylate cyclase
MPIAVQDGYGSNSERKRVTVLFSDLADYSALCERLDPEDVREMMNPVLNPPREPRGGFNALS